MRLVKHNVFYYKNEYSRVVKLNNILLQDKLNEIS
jgi:hypothetical protein